MFNMKKCKAFSSISQKQCSNKPFGGSLYCWHHQDRRPLLISIVISFVIGIITGWLVNWWWTREAQVFASCYPIDNDYCAMECKIENKGNKNAEDTVISFSYLLPTGTRLLADQGYNMSLDEYENIPDPNNYNPGSIEDYKTFNVVIPNIPSKQSLVFSVRSEDKKNQIACDYLSELMDRQEEIIKALGTQLKNQDPEQYGDWNISDFIGAKKKRANLYRPNKVHSENDIRDVVFLDPREDTAFSRITEEKLGNLLSADCNGSMNIAKTNNLPVVSVETGNGNVLLMIWPSYMCLASPHPDRTKMIDFSVLKEIPSTVLEENRIKLPLIQPESYD